jgi:hypothetical protein
MGWKWKIHPWTLIAVPRPTCVSDIGLFRQTMRWLGLWPSSLALKANNRASNMVAHYCEGPSGITIVFQFLDFSSKWVIQNDSPRVGFAFLWFLLSCAKLGPVWNDLAWELPLTVGRWGIPLVIFLLYDVITCCGHKTDFYQKSRSHLVMSPVQIGPASSKIKGFHNIENKKNYAKRTRTKIHSIEMLATKMRFRSTYLGRACNGNVQLNVDDVVILFLHHDTIWSNAATSDASMRCTCAAQQRPLLGPESIGGEVDGIPTWLHSAYGGEFLRARLRLCTMLKEEEGSSKGGDDQGFRCPSPPYIWVLVVVLPPLQALG